MSTNPNIPPEIANIVQGLNLQSLGIGNHIVEITHVTGTLASMYTFNVHYQDSFRLANAITMNFPLDGVRIYVNQSVKTDDHYAFAEYLNVKPKLAPGQTVSEAPARPAEEMAAPEPEKPVMMLAEERIYPGDAILQVKTRAGAGWEDFIPLNEQEELDEGLEILKVGWDHPPNKLPPQSFQIRYRPAGSYQWKIKSYAAPEPRKESWQMTLAEYMEHNYDPVRDSGEKRRIIEYGHRDVIESALQEGKPVPARVLQDYPDLQPQPVKTHEDFTRERIERNTPKFNFIQQAIQRGARVDLHTAYRIVFLPRPDMIRLTSKGEVQALDGRNWVFLTEPQVDSLYHQAVGNPAPPKPIGDMTKAEYDAWYRETGLAPITPTQVKTAADVDRYRYENPINGQIQSRYRTMVDLFGQASADRMMREMEVQSWGKPERQEPITTEETAKLYSQPPKTGHWSQITDALVKLTKNDLDTLRDKLQEEFDDSPVRMNGTKTEEIKSFISWADSQERFDKVIELASRIKRGGAPERVITANKVQLRPEEVQRLLPEVDRVIYGLTHQGQDKMRNPRKFMESVTVVLTPAPFSPGMAETEFGYLFSWNGRSLEKGPGWSQDTLPNMPDAMTGQERMINVPPGRRVWEIVYNGSGGGYWSRVNVYVNPADWPKYLP